MKITIRNRWINHLYRRLRVKWQVVFTSFDDEAYFKAKGRLIQAGIDHKTRVIPMNHGSKGIGMTRTYDIKVKAHDAMKAYEAIRK